METSINCKVISYYSKLINLIKIVYYEIDLSYLNFCLNMDFKICNYLSNNSFLIFIINKLFKYNVNNFTIKIIFYYRKNKRK